MSEQEIHKWFIAHVAYCNEGHVKNLFDIAGMEYYMPFKSVTRTWKGKTKEIQVPAIHSCVFVRVPQSDFIMLQMMKEITLMLDKQGTPLSLEDEQMNVVRRQLDTSDNPGEVVLELLKE